MLFFQAFVRLTNQATGQEIFFVAQPEDNVYKFSLVNNLNPVYHFLSKYNTAFFFLDHL